MDEEVASLRICDNNGEEVPLNPDRMAGAICPGCGSWMNIILDVETMIGSFYCAEPTTDGCKGYVK